MPHQGGRTQPQRGAAGSAGQRPRRVRNVGSNASSTDGIVFPATGSTPGTRPPATPRTRPLRLRPPSDHRRSAPAVAGGTGGVSQHSTMIATTIGLTDFRDRPPSQTLRTSVAHRCQPSRGPCPHAPSRGPSPPTPRPRDINARASTRYLGRTRGRPWADLMTARGRLLVDADTTAR